MSHRIEFLRPLPVSCYLAVSGGPDSMAVLNFLMRGNRDVIALHFNHGTEHGAQAEAFVRMYCEKFKVPLIVGNIENFREREKKESPEEYWRNARYNFFEGFSDRPIVTAHNLDDQVENWIFTSIRNGNPTLIPQARDLGSAKVVRPFLLTKKETLEWWCNHRGIPYVVDPGNDDFKHTRSFIRHQMVPQALKVNPGLYKMIKKKML